MSEYPPKICPFVAHFGTEPPPTTETPKPKVRFLNPNKQPGGTLGTPATDYPPELQKSPVPDDPKIPIQPQNGELKGILKKTDPESKPQDAEEPKPTSVIQDPNTESSIYCYMPKPEDAIPDTASQDMGPIGPWATGRIDWGPLAGLTGTRPVVDKYSITRYSEGEWRGHNKEVLDFTDMEQRKANLIAWNSKQCLEQSQSTVDGNQLKSTERISQRCMEIHKWKCELERAIAAASEEISFIEEQRKRLKQATSILQIPESIAGECLERRASRMDPELVRDDVEEELIKELALIAEIRETFTRTLKDVEKQLLEDKTAKTRLEYDWSDKSISSEMESINQALNTKSTTLMFHPGAVILPEDQSTPEYWEHFTRESLQEGEATRQRSVTLRGSIDGILTSAAKDLRAQADKVELALAKRVDCTEQITERLEHDLKTVLQNMADIECLIDKLREAVRKMDLPMKICQTRLHNRIQRPRAENCRDDACFGLLEEVKSIGENVASLQSQLQQAEDSRAQLITARGNLELEIMLKRRTLEIDRQRTTLIRSHYPSADALSGY